MLSTCWMKMSTQREYCNQMVDPKLNFWGQLYCSVHYHRKELAIKILKFDWPDRTLFKLSLGCICIHYRDCDLCFKCYSRKLQRYSSASTDIPNGSPRKWRLGKWNYSAGWVRVEEEREESFYSMLYWVVFHLCFSSSEASNRNCKSKKSFLFGE